MLSLGVHIFYDHDMTTIGSIALTYAYKGIAMCITDICITIERIAAFVQCTIKSREVYDVLLTTLRNSHKLYITLLKWAPAPAPAIFFFS